MDTWSTIRGGFSRDERKLLENSEYWQNIPGIKSNEAPLILIPKSN